MVVSKNIERLERSAVRLTVTVGRDEVRKAYDDTLKEYSKGVRMDGFRKGKVPAAVLERKFGPTLKLDAMGRLMEDAVQSALEGETLVPLSYAQPSLEGDPKFDLDADFSFAVTYDAFPEVSAGDVAGAEVEIPQCVVAKADEERELDGIRERNAVVADRVDGAAARKGDIATVDYAELDAAGAVVKGSERQGFVFEIGSGLNLYQFDDDVVGMKKGDRRTVSKSFPADYRYPELAGQSRSLEVTLTRLKEKKLPALDDDLAQDVSEKFKTLDDLRADVRSRLEKRVEDRLKTLKEKAIVDVLLERSSVELPASMVAAELEARKRNLMQRMGIETEEKLAGIVDMSGRTVDSLFDEWRPDAERAIRTRLVMDKLVADGGYQCSDEDLATEYAKMAAESNLSPDEVKAEYERRGMVDYLRDRVKEDRLMADLAGKVKAKKGKKQSFLDLFKENE